MLYLPTLDDILSNLIASLLAAIIIGVLTLIFRSIQGKRGKQSTELSGMGVATVVDDFVKRQKKASLRRQNETIQPIVRRVVVEHRETRSSSSNVEPLGIIFIVLIIVVYLDILWTTFKIPILYAMMVVIGVGLGTSAYYILQLRKMNPPYQLEDYLLSWGGFVIWIISIATSWLAVNYPLYKDPVDGSASFDLLFVHAGQLIGMFLLFIAIILTALIQYIAGHIYQNALQSRPPNRFEIYIWEKRLLFSVIILISMIIAFALSTGIFF